MPKAVEHKALPILFADDTSILLTSPNNTQMQSDFNIIFEQLIKWFKSNLLYLNFDKTYFIQFTNKSTCSSDIQISYEDKQISIVNETKFLGLFVNKNLSWNTHIKCVGYGGIVRSDKHSKTHIQYLLMFQCRIQRVMQVVTSCQNRIGWPGLARMVVLQT